jgi:two-component system cell cycle sensor histidine kinase/response regulator CckA
MRLRALIIEDSEPDALLVIHELRRGGSDVEVQVVDTIPAIRAALASRWDFVLCDWSLSGFTALQVLPVVRELASETPVIIVSGTITEDLAVSVMRAGAQDFVLKDRLSRLVPAVQREVRDAETRAAARRAEHQVQASAERYRQLFESTPLPMWVYDLETLRILTVNEAAVRRYGYTREEFVELGLADLRRPEDQVKLRADIANRTDAPAIWRHVTKRGEELAVEITAHDLDFEGRPARLVLANDVTERQRLEEQLRQSQKMEAIGRLAGGVAHDFNNILCVIMSYSETLLDTLDPGEMRDDVEQIRNAGVRGAALTRQLLMFNRQQLLEPRVLDLNDVLTDMGKMLKRLLREDIELVSITDPVLGQVRADQGSLEQVIMNLVVNARDAMPAGGKLTLETANVELDQVYAHDHLGVDPGRYVMILVADTGVGMDPATQARIFEPFFTTKERGRGTGLGLSTVFGIIQQNHGHVWVESRPSVGTTFRVYLPRIDAATTPIRPRGRPITLYGNETILLVEDDDQVRAVALAILKKFGYVVIAAHDGDEAQRHCEAHPHRIHLLLTDVVMPGITGPELARRLQRIRPDMKVLCMSGYTDEADRPGMGPLDTEIAYLQKPFTAEALSIRVRGVIDGDQDAEPGAR